MNYTLPLFKKFKKRIIKFIGTYREVEYNKAFRFFENCRSIIDVGCGTGGFLEILRKKERREIFGIDFNPDCVDACLKKGLNVIQGNALDIPFKENRFDGAYCSHVLHVFHSSEAAALIKELSRIVRPGGVIAIATVPMYEKFFFDPADARPYPPEALRGMFSKPTMEGHSAPTLAGLPSLTEVAIWFRHPALFDLNFQKSQKVFSICQLLNKIQYNLFLRKYWTFNGYIMVFRNTKEEFSLRHV
jgi:SAM-dependent methyltransferase